MGPLLLVFSSQDGLAQQVADTTSTQIFDFPIEEGNVWTYLAYGFPFCGPNYTNTECEYSKLEVTSGVSNESRKCGIFERIVYTFSSFSMGEHGVYFTEDDVTFKKNYSFQLCQEGNRLYWFDEEIDIEADFLDRDMIANFSWNETQPWILEHFEDNPDFPYTLRRLTEKSASEPYEYIFRSYLAQNETDVDGVFGYEFVFSRHGHFRDGTGFHIYGYDPDIHSLKASYINDVLTGDTTFVYPTSIETPDELPREIRLDSYPNPFNPAATITFDLPDAAHIMLRILDLHGREVTLLVDEVRSPGSHHVVFEAAHLSSGLYLVELRSGGVRTVRKITLMK